MIGRTAGSARNASLDLFNEFSEFNEREELSHRVKSLHITTRGA
jgi:hypothetical protein